MNAKTRAELKQYFVSNAIPTQDNFAALIDAQINQADDGVFKEINQPLGIVAATGEQRRVLQLYSEHPADNPAWLVSLRPKDPANPSNFVAGLGIADGAGNTRLLLDAAGNLKVVGRFHVQGRYSAPLAKDNNDRPGIAITGDYPQLDLFSGVNNSNHGATIRLGAFNDGSKTTFKHWVIGTAGRNASFLDIGYSPNNDPNPHAGIRNYSPGK